MNTRYFGWLGAALVAAVTLLLYAATTRAAADNRSTLSCEVVSAPQGAHRSADDLCRTVQKTCVAGVEKIYRSVYGNSRCNAITDSDVETTLYSCARVVFTGQNPCTDRGAVYIRETHNDSAICCAVR